MSRKAKLPIGIRYSRNGKGYVAVFTVVSGEDPERRTVLPVDLPPPREFDGEVTLKEAVAQRVRWMDQVRKGEYKKKKDAVATPVPVPEAEPVIYVKDLWEPYIRQYRNDGGKDEGRQNISWNHLRPVFAELPVAKVTTALIGKYIESRQQKGIKNGTINRELAILKAMYRLGEQSTMENAKRMVKHEQLPAFPKKLEEGKPRRGFLKDEQFAVLAANAKVPWLRCFIECAYKFGFRRGELLGLRKRQVDLIDGRIYLEDTKSGDPRTIAMTGTMRELMLVLLRGKNVEDYVFTRTDGQHVVDPRSEWYDLCVSCGLGKFVPAVRKNGEKFLSYTGLNIHDFRRSAIRNIVRRGVGEKTAMTISGHATRAVFDRYNIVDETDLALATQKIEAGRQVDFSGVESDTKVTHEQVAHS